MGVDPLLVASPARANYERGRNKTATESNATWGELRAALLARLRGLPDAEAEALRIIMGPFPVHVDAETKAGVWTRLTVHSRDSGTKLYRVTVECIEPPRGV